MSRVKKLLCWWQHDWTMTTNIKLVCETEDGTAYTYERACQRKGCGLHQEISINNIKGVGRLNYIEKEWAVASS